MPAYKDKAGKWYCKFYFEDYEGVKRQKLKRGFELKRDAEAWERDFLANIRYEPEMTFSAFLDIYRADIDSRLREHTIQTREYRIKNQIEPFFGQMRMKDIDAKVIASWQNGLIEQGFSNVYMGNLQKSLSAIFNHAIRFYGLRSNPCNLAGTVRASDEAKKEMRFWTLEEYQKVIEEVQDIKAKAAICLLYWSGMRKGELLALTWSKLDFETGTVKIDRSLQRLKGRDVITPTKTYESRTIMLPAHVLTLLEEYRAACYDTAPAAAVFPWEKRFIELGIAAGCMASGVKRIHVHGLRHSHASLLIQQGVNIVLISKRLGHAQVSMTLDTYSHFFPTEEKSVISQLDNLVSGDTNLILKNHIEQK